MGVMATSAQEVNVSTADTTNQTAINRAIFDRVSAALAPKASLPLNELVVEVALQFLGTQYLWASLESVPEQLHVFLDKTDCILFVELSTCFALTLKGIQIEQGPEVLQRPLAPASQQANGTKLSGYELLVHNILNMRYRRGQVDTYSSRIHYTSEWLLQNQANGLMREFTGELGEEFTQTFSYMSDHPKTYYQLSNDPCELGRIRMMELWLDEQKPYYYISQERLRDPKVMEQIHSGDIITFISPRRGLDLAHVAIAYFYQGQMHFIHASYGAKKVIIEPKTLADYATNGLRITRLMDK